METINTFTGGMVMDISELSQDNKKVLNSCLNGTLITFNDNEFVLQNDLGNAKILYGDNKEEVTLPKGYYPVGVTSFGNIIYFCLKDNIGNCLIGTFPSPDYESTDGKLVYKYAPLKVGKKGDNTVDLITEYLNFDDSHTVLMVTTTSYDGSVNIILNDDHNIPRLINSGFAVKDNEKCIIIEHLGLTTTNRYDLQDENNFKMLTSLIKHSSLISTVEYNGFLEYGFLPVGIYAFYFKYADADGNETDFFCESGTIQCFMGTDKDPFSINGAFGKYISNKTIRLTIENCDSAYKYVKVYYTWSSSDIDQNAVLEAYKILKNYEIFKVGDKYKCFLSINGEEDKINIPITDLLKDYIDIDYAKTADVSLNRLFLGNVKHSAEEIHSALETFSQRFYPVLSIKESDKLIGLIDGSDYTDHTSPGPNNSIEKYEYFNSKNSYRNVGYHNNEYYRFGIVYIMSDGSLSSVYNTLGNLELTAELLYLNNDINKEISKDGHYILGELSTSLNKYGICKLKYSELDDFKKIIGIQFNFSVEANKIDGKSCLLTERLNEFGIIGYFFVRLKRIPTLLTLMSIVDLNKYARLPMLKTTATINDVNVDTYYLESFLANRTGDDINTEWPITGFSKDTLNTISFLPNWGIHSEKDTTWHNLEGLSSENYVEYTKILYYLIVPILNIAIKYKKQIASGENDWKADVDYIKAEATLNDNNIQFTLDKSGTRKYTTRIGQIYESLQWIAKLLLIIMTKENKSYWDLIGLSENAFNEGLYKMILGYGERGSSGWVTKDFIEYTSIYKDGQLTPVREFNFAGGLPNYEGLFLRLGISETVNINNDINWDAEIKPAWMQNYFYNQLEASESALTTYKNLLNIVKLNMERANQFRSNQSYAGYSAEYMLDLPYFNLLFTGREFVIKKISNDAYNINNRRIYPTSNNELNPDDVIWYKAKLITVTEDTKSIYIDDYPFRGTAGNPTIAYEALNSISTSRYALNNSLVRGKFSPYIGVLITLELKLESGSLIWKDVNDNVDRTGTYNIYIPNYLEADKSVNDYYDMRREDYSPYYSISDRISKDITENIICYRGDCYTSLFTERINRNFNDPDLPYNDVIVDPTTWNNYCIVADEDRLAKPTDYPDDLGKRERVNNINLGDVNAVLLGLWFTFRTLTSTNVSIRSFDSSYSQEYTESGQYRSFYPLTGINIGGTGKLAESNVYNKGYNKTVNEKQFITMNDAPYINTYFGNRIMYSNIDSVSEYANGNRVFDNLAFRDYPTTYGAITKIIEWQGNLVCVLEHGVYLVPVNERTLAGSSSGGNVYINTDNVLPLNPKVISDSYGSKWIESVIKTPVGIYGVDTEAHRIWLFNGLLFSLISDYRIQNFLNRHMSVGIDDATPKIAEKNVKTHYNELKGDVMFTFYNDSIRWNLCWNELTKVWQTFYTWIPESSSNIGNTFVTVNLNQCNTAKSFINKAVNLYSHHSTNKNIQTEKIKPTYWYDTLHPFEYTFIVADNPDQHKIFNNLEILSNNAEPESFHYEIIGDCFDFANDKGNMFYRLEKYKESREYPYDSDYIDFEYEEPNNLSTKLCSYYNPNYTEIKDEKDIDKKEMYKMCNIYSLRTCNHLDSDNNKIHSYVNLSGGEVIHYKSENELRIVDHVSASDIKKVGRMRGNMTYLEDRWKVQINPITLQLTNDDPEDVNAEWSRRKEVKLKDKYIKIRVRYSGEKLAIITALKTLYTISYA